MVLQRLVQPLVRRAHALMSFALTVIARGSLRQVPPVGTAGASPVTHAYSPTLVRQQLVQGIVTQRMTLPLLHERRNVVQTVRGPQPVPAAAVAHGSHTHVAHLTAYPRLTISVARQAAASAALASENAAARQGDSVQPGPAWGLPRTASASDASATRHHLPPQELSRVTDHVLAQLDRKVLSYRERHGQI